MRFKYHKVNKFINGEFAIYLKDTEYHLMKGLLSCLKDVYHISWKDGSGYQDKVNKFLERKTLCLRVNSNYELLVGTLGAYEIYGLEPFSYLLLEIEYD